MLPAQVAAEAARKWPLLGGLLAVGAGYWPKAAGRVPPAPEPQRPLLGRRSEGGPDPVALGQATFIYCQKGGGWCELAGRLHAIRAGDLLVLSSEGPHTCGAQASNPWTIHWASAGGGHLGAYLKGLGVSGQAPVLRVGEDLQLARLFNEILTTLEHGIGFVDLLQASHALAYLLARLIGQRQEEPRQSSDAAHKVAEAIIYMSDHLEEPLRVAALARLASLSTAHFCVLFKDQTGCAPREYLHLLRIHRACQLLQSTALNVKEIAGRLGYQDPFHFSRQFKAFQGVSPSDYRERGTGVEGRVSRGEG